MSGIYAESFLTKKPKEGIQIVQTRLKDATIVDNELIEYFKERIQIEQDYAKSLLKASKKLYTMDAAVLGHFGSVWESLLNELIDNSTLHSNMASEIALKVEEPLKTASMQDYRALDKFEFMIEKNTKSPSVRGSILRKTKNQTNEWKTDGLDYLNTAQTIDEIRLNRIKSMVERFEQIQLDGLQQRIKVSQHNLSIAKGFDVDHDIHDFCIETRKSLVTLKPSESNTETHVSPKHRTSLFLPHDNFRPSDKLKSLFGKKKKSLDRVNEEEPSTINSEPTMEYSSPLIHSPPKSNLKPALDEEGYSIPPPSYDLQSFQSKLKIDIKPDSLQEEDAAVSFNKVANLLRERQPTVHRKPRGRRDSLAINPQPVRIRPAWKVTDDVTYLILTVEGKGRGRIRVQVEGTRYVECRPTGVWDGHEVVWDLEGCLEDRVLAKFFYGAGVGKVWLELEGQVERRVLEV